MSEDQEQFERTEERPQLADRFRGLLQEAHEVYEGDSTKLDAQAEDSSSPTYSTRTLAILCLQYIK